MSDLLAGSLFGLLYFVFVIAMVILVLVRKRDPQAALGWSLVVVFIPVIGPLFFLIAGLMPVPKPVQRMRAHREEMKDQLPDVAKTSRIAPETEDSLEARIATLAINLDQSAPTIGNRVQLLKQGREAFEHIFKAIEAAQHHIHVEKYIFRKDGLGERMATLLQQKAAAGVEVRLIVDGIGTLSARWLMRKLRKAGGQAQVFNPLLARGFSLNFRNHRKIVVVDGDTAFFGGLNVGDEYLGRGRKKSEWFDMHLEVHGPAALDVQRIFVEDWAFCGQAALTGEAYFPKFSPPPSKDAHERSAKVQLLSGGPDQDPNPIHQVIFTAVARADRTLDLATPYVALDKCVRKALTTASRGGVRVRLLTQSWPPDHYIPWLCGSFWFEDLLSAGVEIYGYTAGMMHAKAVIVDGEWATVGSANLDNRSFHLNFEINGVFTSTATVAAIAERFQGAIDQSKQWTLEAYEQRGFWRRVGESLARLLSPLI